MMSESPVNRRSEDNGSQHLKIIKLGALMHTVKSSDLVKDKNKYIHILQDQCYSSIHFISSSGNSVTSQQTLTRINDGQCAHPVVFTTSGAKLNVVSTVVVDTGLGQHGVVLNL